MQYTPRYKLPYSQQDEPVQDIWIPQRDLALKVEEVFTNASLPPGNPDLSNVIARLNAVDIRINQDLPLKGRWVNFGNGFHFARIAKIGSIVSMQGLVKRLDGSDNLICNIPPAYRPTSHIAIVTNIDDTSMARLTINANGDVVIVAPNGAIAYTSITASWII